MVSSHNFRSLCAHPLRTVLIASCALCFSLSAAVVAPGNTTVTAAPVQPAASTPAAVPVGSPAETTRQTLSDFLANNEPKRLDALNAQNADQAHALLNIRQLEQFNRATDLEDAYLYYLTKFPPDAQNYLDTLARLTQLINQRNDDPALLITLFNAGKTFPKSGQPAQQMRVWEAEYLLRIGLVQSALVALQELCDQPDLAPQVRMIAAGRAGFIHDRLGQPDDALRYYLMAAQDLTAGTQANEAQLRAALLMLEMGRTDDAIAAINKLKGVPPEILAASTATNRIISDLLALTADPDHARAYWNQQQKWYPQWRALAPTLGMKTDAGDQPPRSAFIDNYTAIEQQATLAFAQKDLDAYFQLVDLLLRSARWHPSDLTAGAYLLYQGTRIDDAHKDQILAQGALLEDGLAQIDQGLYKQLAQLRVAALIENHKLDTARDLAGSLLAQYGKDDAAGQGFARLYGEAVLGSQSVRDFGEEAARLLAETLSNPANHGPQRPFAVAVLSDLYVSLGREADARALLEKELPTLPTTNDWTTKLRDELARLQQRQLVNSSLGTSVAAWWDKYQLPWYKYTVSPPEASSLSTADVPAVQVARNFARAMEGSVPLTSRAAALQDAWNAYPEMPLTGSALVDSANAFVKRSDLPADLRLSSWTKTMWHLLWSGQRAAAEKLLADAPAEASADDRADYMLWIDYLAQPITLEAQQAFADKLIAQPKVRQFGVMLAVRIVDSLARLGAFDAAKAAYQKLEGAKLDDSGTQQYRQMAPTIAALIESYKSTLPAYEALRKVVLDARPGDLAAAQLPANWLNLNNIWMPNLALLTQSEARQGLLAVIRDRLPYGQHPIQVFLDYGQSLAFTPEDNALRFQLFETAERYANSDDDRFYAALFMGLVDFDDPGVAQRGWALLAPSRTPAYPKASSVIQYYDTMMKWRSGADVDITADFGPLTATTLDPYRLRLALDYYLQRGDRDALLSIIQSHPHEQDFYQGPVLGAYLRALRLLGKEAALTRASDAAQVEIAKAVVESWAKPDIETAQPVFDLARALDSPDAYPRRWVGALLANVHNENARDLVRIADGRIQKDWPAVLVASDSYLARNPTNYDAYWPKAEALMALGRNAEALAPLRIFVKYSHNADEYPEAQLSLKKIEAEVGQPATAAALPPAKP